MRQRAVGRHDAEPMAQGLESGVACWCGATGFEPLRADYACCRACGTVVYTEPIDAGEYTAASGFYGDAYWRRHVPRVLGLPGLEERARSDLSERAVFHLVKVLGHLAPGGRVLELGCGAGSLLYLLRQAGFDATGLELGPAAIEVARCRFGVEVRRGPLEAYGDGETWDAVVAVDVLEHLPDPLATITLCARRLAAGGRLFLQTPCYRGEGAQWSMLLPEEHLHLFTESSARRLLREAGFTAIEVGPSLFHHDMWIVAALAAPLERRPEPLAELPPVIVGLIDATAERTRAQAERDAVDADRRRKEQDVETLRRELESVRGELAAVRADRRAKGEVVDRLSAELETVRGDQAAKEAAIERLRRGLETVSADQGMKAALIEHLSAELEAVRADQSAKAELIDRLSAELETVRADQGSKAELIDRLGTELESVREDQQAKERLIRRLDAELVQGRAELEETRAGLERKQAELEGVRGELAAIRADRLYRLLQAARRRLGGRR